MVAHVALDGKMTQKQIVIVWNNVGKEMPLKLWNSLGPHPVPVVFKKQSRTLNTQQATAILWNWHRRSVHAHAFVWCVYIPWGLMIIYILKYLLAVLMLDDDILISFPDVSFAFSVWKVIKSATVWLTACILAGNNYQLWKCCSSLHSCGFKAISGPDSWLCFQKTHLNSGRRLHLWQLGPKNRWRWQVKIHIWFTFLLQH